MSINVSCMFCNGLAFMTRSLFIHPYEPEEIELIKKIDQEKLAALRKTHNGFLVACYKCLAEHCPKESNGSGVEPRANDIISVQEP